MKHNFIKILSSFLILVYIMSLMLSGVLKEYKFSNGELKEITDNAENIIH